MAKHGLLQLQGALVRGRAHSWHARENKGICRKGSMRDTSTDLERATRGTGALTHNASDAVMMTPLPRWSRARTHGLSYRAHGDADRGQDRRLSHMVGHHYREYDLPSSPLLLGQAALYGRPAPSPGGIETKPLRNDRVSSGGPSVGRVPLGYRGELPRRAGTGRQRR